MTPRTAAGAVAVLSALVTAFMAGVVFAQGRGALDPVRVAPHIFSLAFENERVRVLERTIRNGETPPIMSQPDRVIIYLNPCAWLEDDGDGGKQMRDYKFGEPTWQPANSHGGSSIPVVQECRVVEVELK